MLTPAQGAHDQVSGIEAPMWVFGGDGEDYIGGGGHDNLFGEQAVDWLYGNEGDDFLDGGPGADWIFDNSGTNFFADTQTWPDELPWPELNLVADVTADVILDDRGPGWDSSQTYQGPPYPPEDPEEPGYWFTQENAEAFGGSQSHLYADEKTGEEGGEPDGLGDGENTSVWYAPVWTKQANVYVSWVPRGDAATNAPFVVTTMEGVRLPEPDSVFQLDQTNAPDQQGFPFQEFDGRMYTELGTFNLSDGWLVVTVSDYGVALGECIVADVVLVLPSQTDPGSEVRPGSWANREENGFYGGLLLEMQDPNASWRKVQIGVEDPNDELAGKKLQLNFEGDGTVIEVYSDADMTQRVYSGDTWDIGEMPNVWVKAAGAGSTEITLTLEDPIFGERPLADVLAITVNA